MPKKYELTNKTKKRYGHTLYQIRALKNFGAVKAGELGGWIETEYNLSQNGDCWICDNAVVYRRASVCNNAVVCDNAVVRSNAMVCDNAVVCDNVVICGHAVVCGNATVHNNAIVCENAIICDDATVCDSAGVSGNVVICGKARVGDFAGVDGNATICGDATICQSTDYTVIQGFGRVQRTTTFYRLKDGDIGVTCGCFNGTIREFRDKVKETHRNSKYAQEYLMIADLMELHFKEGSNNEKRN